MTQDRIGIYEGLFLFPQSAAADLQSAVDHLKGLLDRASAEIISFCKWDERKLAYEIKGNKRGVYFLTYFKAPASNLITLERHCNLSEQLLRFMITKADLIPQQTIMAAEGQSKLADEIRLRSEKRSESGAVGAVETSRVESRSKLEKEAESLPEKKNEDVVIKTSSPATPATPETPAAPKETAAPEVETATEA